MAWRKRALFLMALACMVFPSSTVLGDGPGVLPLYMDWVTNAVPSRASPASAP